MKNIDTLPLPTEYPEVLLGIGRCVEVAGYSYYDGPGMASYMTDTGRLLLLFWIGDEAHTGREYALVDVTAADLDAIHQQEKSFRTVFIEAAEKAGHFMRYAAGVWSEQLDIMLNEKYEIDTNVSVLKDRHFSPKDHLYIVDADTIDEAVKINYQGASRQLQAPVLF